MAIFGFCPPPPQFWGPPIPRPPPGVFLGTPGIPPSPRGGVLGTPVSPPPPGGVFWGVFLGPPLGHPGSPQDPPGGVFWAPIPGDSPRAEGHSPGGRKRGVLGGSKKGSKTPQKREKPKMNFQVGY